MALHRQTAYVDSSRRHAVMHISPVHPSPSSATTIALPDPAAALYSITSLGAHPTAPHPVVSTALASHDAPLAPPSSTALVVRVFLHDSQLV
jgi:hypothetical protein